MGIGYAAVVAEAAEDIYGLHLFIHHISPVDNKENSFRYADLAVGVRVILAQAVGEISFLCAFDGHQRRLAKGERLKVLPAGPMRRRK